MTTTMITITAEAAEHAENKTLWFRKLGTVCTRGAGLKSCATPVDKNRHPLDFLRSQRAPRFTWV